jgi:hypothetical protein
MRRLLLILTVCVGLLLTTPAQTQHRTTFEQITVANTAIGITAAIRNGMSGCMFRLETAQIRWRIDAAPTTTVGTLLEVGDVFAITRAEDLIAVKFIRTTSTSGLLNVNCWTAARP